MTHPPRNNPPLREPAPLPNGIPDAKESGPHPMKKQKGKREGLRPGEVLHE